MRTSGYVQGIHRTSVQEVDFIMSLGTELSQLQI